MQKNYKNYLIKSTANNKRYKLYYKDEPNVEIFMSPYLSDVMAYIKIEEDELYVADEFNITSPAQTQQDRDAWLSKHTINPDWTPEKAAIALAQLNNMANPDIKILRKIDAKHPSAQDKPIVKKKTSMKMKKKA